MQLHPYTILYVSSYTTLDVSSRAKDERNGKYVFNSLVVLRILGILSQLVVEMDCQNIALSDWRTSLSTISNFCFIGRAAEIILL